jgi:type IV pilus assembly protein PilM
VARLAGLGPKPVPPHVFALDRRRVRYAGFAAEREGLRLADYRERPLPPDTFVAGLLGESVRDGEGLARTIAELAGDLGAPVRDAALVLPDAWLRLAFAEVGDLPRAPQAREEVLRWKLRRLVPFRVDELRVAGSEVEPLASQAEPRRLLLGFALEQLLAQAEAAFGAAGVRLGLVANTSLALLGALRDRPADGLDVVAQIDADGQSLLVARGDVPVLHRFRPAEDEPAGDGRLVVRDLRLTRSFLSENLPGAELRRVLLLAPPGLVAPWLEWLSAGLGRPAAPLGLEHLRMAGDPGPAWSEAASLLGAACVEIQ